MSVSTSGASWRQEAGTAATYDSRVDGHALSDPDVTPVTTVAIVVTAVVSSTIVEAIDAASALSVDGRASGLVGVGLRLAVRQDLRTLLGSVGAVGRIVEDGGVVFGGGGRVSSNAALRIGSQGENSQEADGLGHHFEQRMKHDG